jgi:hypothetical protein
MAPRTPNFLGSVPTFRAPDPTAIMDALGGVVRDQQEARRQTESERSNRVQEGLEGRRVNEYEAAGGNTREQSKQNTITEVGALVRQGKFAEAMALAKQAGLADYVKAIEDLSMRQQAKAAPAAPAELPGMVPYRAGGSPLQMLDALQKRSQPAPAEMPGMVAPAAPPAPPEPPSMADLFEQGAASERAAVQGAVPGNDPKAASSLADAARMSGKGPFEAANIAMLDDRSREIADSRNATQTEVAKIRKKGGGVGGPSGAGWDEEKVKFVRSVINDQGRFEQANKLNAGLQAAEQALADIDRGALGERKAFATMLKGMFGAASSNSELAFVLGAGGVQGRIQQMVEQLSPDGSGISDSMILQMKDSIRGAARTALDQKRRLAESTAAIVATMPNGYSNPEEAKKYIDWARSVILGSHGGQAAPGGGQIGERVDD